MLRYFPRTSRKTCCLVPCCAVLFIHHTSTAIKRFAELSFAGVYVSLTLKDKYVQQGAEEENLTPETHNRNIMTKYKHYFHHKDRQFKQPTLYTFTYKSKWDICRSVQNRHKAMRDNTGQRSATLRVPRFLISILLRDPVQRVDRPERHSKYSAH